MHLTYITDGIAAHFTSGQGGKACCISLTMGKIHFFVIVLMTVILGGCASLPPGHDFPKSVSLALADPNETRLGGKFNKAAQQHPGTSGFHLIQAGADGFVMRMQMIKAAQRTLDLQYYIFHGDETGLLLTRAILQAADRGVRVRLLVDDGETVAGDEQIAALAAHPLIQIRIFNPLKYRGHNTVLRGIEFSVNASRLDYRMHNKLIVVDNSVALIGGRNIGDPFFQIDPKSQFADDDVFTVGPIVKKLSMTFDEFWNSTLAIPVQALSEQKASLGALLKLRQILKDHQQQLSENDVNYVKRVSTGQPFNASISNPFFLTWASAKLVYDSPYKKKVQNGDIVGRLLQPEVAKVSAAVQSELLMITPYFIPGEEGMQLFQRLRQRNVGIRVLTNSLESSVMVPAHSGYMHYRIPLLEKGVELYEVRSFLGDTKGSGQTAAISRFGNYGLHAKLFVFDRKKLFIGSMNFDQRSMHINTEIGLIIDSPELAQKLAARFNAMVQPENAYRLVLRSSSPDDCPHLVWDTQIEGKDVEYDKEPSSSEWQRIKVNILSLLPLDDEL